MLELSSTTCGRALCRMLPPPQDRSIGAATWPERNPVSSATCNMGATIIAFARTSLIARDSSITRAIAIAAACTALAVAIAHAVLAVAVAVAIAITIAVTIVLASGLNPSRSACG